MSWPSMTVAPFCATEMVTQAATRAPWPLSRRRPDADRCLFGIQSTSMSSEVVIVDAPDTKQ
jgi:hypothetical protein